MALAPDNLRVTLQYQDWYNSDRNPLAGGGIGLVGNVTREYYATFQWDEHETNSCFYRVETKHSGVWTFLADVDKGIGLIDILVANNPSGGSTTALITDVRITCITIPDDGSPAAVSLSYSLPAHASVAPSSFALSFTGELTDDTGTVKVTWHDTSVWVTSVNFELRKVSGNVLLVGGLTQDPGYFNNEAQGTVKAGPGPGLFALEHLNKTDVIEVEGFPPWDGGILEGIGHLQVQFPLKRPVLQGQVVDNTYRVSDGDLLSLVMQFNSSHSGAQTKVLTFPYYRVPDIIGFSRAGTVGQPISIQVEIGTDVYSKTGPLTWSATGLPPGCTINSSTGLISGTPTTDGSYYPVVTVVNSQGTSANSLDAYGLFTSMEIDINEAAVPVFTGPAAAQAMLTKVAVSIRLTATNNPISFAVSSGTLPSGLTLDTATGIISGTPKVAGTPSVGFTATNNQGTSTAYTIVFTVTALTTPTISSAAAITAYYGEAVSYTITADKATTDFSIKNLPAGLTRSGSIISGTINSSVTTGPKVVTIRGINQAGSGPEFSLTITVSARLPVVTSKVTATAFVGKGFSYKIAATHGPIKSYSAAGLPEGITLDSTTGVISGTPTTEGVYTIGLTAANASGAGTLTLTLTVALPNVPVIDTTATAGKTITAKSNIDFIFQPVASNSPTSWAAQPIPLGLSFDKSSGQLSGAFAAAGLYSIVFVASNIGGISDPVTFFFLVEQGPPAAVAASGSAGAGVDLWIEVQNGIVSTSSPTIDQPVADTPAKIQAKRGDTLPLTLRFHKSGRPVDLAPTSLKTAGRIDFDEDYLISTANFYPVKDSKGVFVVYPQLSDNSDLDDALEDEDSIDLLSEVQWETSEVLPGLGGTVTTRRSSRTFTLEILRDVINPD